MSPPDGTFAAPVTARARRGLRLGDFRIADGRVHLDKTGNSAPLDRHLLAEVAGWLLFTAAVALVGLVRRQKASPRILFTPDRPHRRYNLRAAATWAGAALASGPEDADAAVFFEDATSSIPPPAPPGEPALNFGCGDISKGRGARLFEDSFGYPLALDPRTHGGPAVEKSERNGAHDGRIVLCPRAPRPGHVYQRLIDAVGGDGMAVDLRTQCVGGAPVLVWIKRRPVAARFLPPNASARLARPKEVFSEGEIAALSRFVTAMGADWCGLDVLRDRDGRIYVVDVNKTDAGPITALPFRDKLRSMALMARALEGAIAARPGA